MGDSAPVETATAPIELSAATEAHIEELVEIAGEFMKRSKYKHWPYNAEGTEAVFRRALAAEDAIIIVAERIGKIVGFTLACMVGNPFVLELQQSQIVLTWVHPDERGDGIGPKLVSLCERWAKQHGADSILGGAPEMRAHRKLKQMFRRRDFKRYEVVYVKGLE